MGVGDCSPPSLKRRDNATLWLKRIKMLSPVIEIEHFDPAALVVACCFTQEEHR
jgi:hypothetical protein